MKTSNTSSTLARYPSPLRYPGGKGKIANFLKLLIIENNLSGIEYVEPYAGGGTVALSLLYEDYVSSVHINDLNRGVFSFWQLVTRNPDTLCAKIRGAVLTVNEWHRQRAVYTDASAAPDELGFATFYLNRTNRSGIIARGGVIGGLAQTGTWKMDARFDRERLIARVEKVGRFANRIETSMLDAEKLLTKYQGNRAALLYLDPPYYLKGSQLYDNHYKHADHVKVHSRVKCLAGHWVVSYDAAAEIIDLYGGHSAITYMLGYSASTSQHGHEAMYFSDDLRVPDVASPANIASQQVQRAISSRQQGLLDLRV